MRKRTQIFFLAIFTIAIIASLAPAAPSLIQNVRAILKTNNFWTGSNTFNQPINGDITGHAATASEADYATAADHAATASSALTADTAAVALNANSATIADYALSAATAVTAETAAVALTANTISDPAGVPVMAAASSGSDGEQGAAPKPLAGDQGKFLRGDATWAAITIPEIKSFNAVLYVDQTTTTPALEQNGSVEKPFSTIQAAIDKYGPATSAADYQRTVLVDVVGGYNYVENLTIPHRAIFIRGAGIKITGNITRLIADEEEFGVSSSTWRACFGLYGMNFGGTGTHPQNIAGIQITGNYQSSVKPGKTGNTTHEMEWRGVTLAGTFTIDAGVGQCTTVFNTCRLRNTVTTGSLIYMTRAENTEFGDSSLAVGAITQNWGLIEEIRNCQFQNNVVFSNAGSVQWINARFRSGMTFTASVVMSIYLDGTSAESWYSNVTPAGSAITIVLLDSARGNKTATGSFGGILSASETDIQKALDKIDDAYQYSIAVVAGKLQLSGDTAAPGNNKVYGTDGSGARGWYSAGGSDAFTVKASATDPTPGFLDDKATKSVVISAEKIQLQNDATAPGNSKLYGTNASGIRGWYDQPSSGTNTAENIIVGTFPINTLLNDSENVQMALEWLNQAISPTTDKKSSIVARGDLGDFWVAALDGDVLDPGNNKLYGTDGTGTKGWYDQPPGGTASLATLTDGPGTIEVTDNNSFVRVYNGGEGVGFYFYKPSGADILYGPRLLGYDGLFKDETNLDGCLQIIEHGLGTVSTPKGSITFDRTSESILLVGDALTPGNNKLYGTNGLGVKGWYNQPAGGATAFTGLTDVPGGYESAGNKFVIVSPEENGLEFQGQAYFLDAWTDDGYSVSVTDDGFNSNGLKLTNDEIAPGNNKLYGTNGSGVKGWYDQPTSGTTALTLGATEATGVQWNDTTKYLANNGTNNVKVNYADTAGAATNASNASNAGTAAVALTAPWSGISGKPSTISGYGITDGVTLTGDQTLLNKRIGVINNPINGGRSLIVTGENAAADDYCGLWVYSTKTDYVQLGVEAWPAANADMKLIARGSGQIYLNGYRAGGPFVGDSGSGGQSGLVPAPASGDAAAGKYLKADGTWATISASDAFTVKASSGDASPGYLDGKVAKSVVVNSNKLELSGDSTTPGNSKLYGTNASGTKGWYDQPSSYTAWTDLGSNPTRTDNDTFSVTDNATNVEIFQPGRPIKYTISSVVYYGMVRAVTDAGATLTVDICGAPYSATSTAFFWGDMFRIKQMNFSINGLFADAADNSLISNDLGSKLRWSMGAAYLVKIAISVKTLDSGAAQDRVNFSIAGNKVATTNSNNGPAPASADTWAETLVDINTTNYDVAFGEALEITTDANGTNGNAQDLAVEAIFVMK